MKKNLVILFVFIFSSFLGYSQENKKSDLEKDNIKGKVKYIEESTYFPKGLFCNGKEMDIHREYKITKFNRDGNIEYEIIRGFHDLWGKIKPLKTIIYKYNSNGQKQECSQIDNEISVVDKYFYDTKGNLIEKTFYKRLRDRIGTSKYKYDSNNRMIEVARYWDDGSLESRESYSYNKKGQIVTKKYYSDFGYYAISYDELKYDSKGNNIESIFYIKDKKDRSSYFKYDDKNNIIESRYWNKNDSLFSTTNIQYKYDKKSNWIWKKYIDGFDSSGDQIIERRIVYYGDKDENNYPLWDNPNYKAEEIETENMKVKF